MPRLLLLTGQSFTGKDTSAEILISILEKKGKSVLEISSGKLLRQYAEMDTPLGREIKYLLEIGERVPLETVTVMVAEQICENIDRYDHIIVNGTPRYAEHCTSLYKLAAEKAISMKVLEITTRRGRCILRALLRTRTDRRADCSFDGYPGIPDMRKIVKKLSWWERAEDAIRAEAKRLDVYLTVANEGTLMELRNNLIDIFFHIKKPL